MPAKKKGGKGRGKVSSKKGEETINKVEAINKVEQIAIFKATYRRDFGWDVVKKTRASIEAPETIWGECVVCLEVKPLLAATSCTHKFCAECLESIFIAKTNGGYCVKKNAPCPLCRQPFLSVNVGNLLSENALLYHMLSDPGFIARFADPYSRMEVIRRLIENSYDILEAVKGFQIGPGGANLLAASVYLNLGCVFFLFPFGAEFEKAEEAFVTAIAHDPRVAKAAQALLRRARLRIEGHLPLPPLSFQEMAAAAVNAASGAVASLIPPLTYLNGVALLMLLCLLLAFYTIGNDDARN
jgi:hypothetical protein